MSLQKYGKLGNDVNTLLQKYGLAEGLVELAGLEEERNHLGRNIKSVGNGHYWGKGREKE